MIPRCNGNVSATKPGLVICRLSLLATADMVDCMVSATDYILYVVSFVLRSGP